MIGVSPFKQRLEAKVAEQLAAQRVGYLLGAGSSFINGSGYPLANRLWTHLRDRIVDTKKRNEIQEKLDLPGVDSLERALDLLDAGGPDPGPHRTLVTEAIADLFLPLEPPLDSHKSFLRRLSAKSMPHTKIFSLNYDPLLERAAEQSHVRLVDGFLGHDHAYFEPGVFEERIVRIRGTYKGRQADETAKPLQLLKLHGSMGWYDCTVHGVRRCSFTLPIPTGTKRLMIPPQRRKAEDTLGQPFQALWSAFRGALGQDHVPLNRLACLGYGFGDEHVNALLEYALGRSDFTLLILTKALSDDAWSRWSKKRNVIIVNEDRCSLFGEPELVMQSSGSFPIFRKGSSYASRVGCSDWSCGRCSG